LGASEEELKETMAIAMTVGATKIQILQENALASLPATNSSRNQPAEKEGAIGEQEVCSA
jgi:hypothetical protein